MFGYYLAYFSSKRSLSCSTRKFNTAFKGKSSFASANPGLQGFWQRSKHFSVQRNTFSKYDPAQGWASLRSTLPRCAVFIYACLLEYITNSVLTVGFSSWNFQMRLESLVDIINQHHGYLPCSPRSGEYFESNFMFIRRHNLILCVKIWSHVHFASLIITQKGCLKR